MEPRAVSHVTIKTGWRNHSEEAVEPHSGQLVWPRLGEKTGWRRHPEDGGARRDRTDDLKLAKLALSQLSYGPVVR